MSTPSQTPEPAEPPEQEGAEDEQPTTPDERAEEGRSRKPLTIALTTLGVVVLLGVVGVLALGPLRSNITEAISEYTGPDLERGECLSMLHPERAGTEFEEVECGSDASDFRIVEHLTGNAECPGDRAYEVLTIDSDVYCMGMDVAVDDCLWIRDGRYLAKVDCGSDNAGRRVTKVADKADKTVCSPGNFYLTYPDPERTVCMKELGNRG